MESYKLNKLAVSDLNGIWEYGLEKFGLDQANYYYNQLLNCCEKLPEQPFRAPAINEIRIGYRRAVCGADNIYYRVNEEVVEVMRVLGNQDVERSVFI